MSVCKILLETNTDDCKILESKSIDIVFDNPEKLKEIVGNMRDTLKASKTGAGLASNQIGVLKRIFVMKHKCFGEPRVFINPVILKIGGIPFISEERCLSRPGVVARVIRHPEILVKWKNKKGVISIKVFSGLEAVVIQHEMDHLNGIRV